MVFIRNQTNYISAVSIISSTYIDENKITVAQKCQWSTLMGNSNAIIYDSSSISVKFKNTFSLQHNFFLMKFEVDG